MQIQFNTGKNVMVSEGLIASSRSLLSTELSRYSHQITDVEVHLSYEDGNNDGFNDKHCMMEARLTGMNPIAVTSQANSHEQAFFGAIHKMKTFLEKITARSEEY